MSKLILIFIVSILVVSNALADEGNLIKQFNELKEKSRELSPELKTARAFHSQKNAQSYTRITTHLPNVSLVLRKEKDFFEEKNASLRALGIGVLNTSWGINYEWSLINLAQIDSTRKIFTENDKSEIDAQIKESEYPVQFTTNFLNYLLAKYKTAAVENSLKKAETGKKEAQIGFDIGQKTKIDVLRSEANLVSLNSNKTTYSEEEQTTKNRFVEYAGLAQSDLDVFNDLT
ncbi:MAG: hypothetical protein H7336_03470, partial [Bacteriovorax sp.]|nr:hypothetical protein [Bacteriovorax sp.]